MTLFLNLWTILTKAPNIIAIIKAIMDVIGSTQVQKILEAIRDAMHDEGAMPNGTTDEPGRKRLATRIRERFARQTLGMSDTEYANFVHHKQQNIA